MVIGEASLSTARGRTAPRTILHFDLDAFFCSVEELLNPELRGRAFVVAGRPQERGVVSSASYPARRHGIHSAMPTAQALRLFPGLLVISPRHGVYGEHSDRVMDYVRDAVPVVEQISIDEAFLDVTDHPRPGHEVAVALQAEIRSRFSLPSSWGIASNKLVAKIATNVGKPGGMIVVPPGQEAAFLAPLPVSMLWGVGPRTQERLASSGVSTIGSLAALPPERLRALFGEHGTELAARARGEDDSPVVEGYEPRSMSSERTFARDLKERAALVRVLRSLSEEVGSRLREAGLAGTTVRLKLRWSDFRTLTRQRRLAQPTDQDGEIRRVAVELFDGVWSRGRPVRLLGVGVTGLGAPVRQLGLFDRKWEEDARLLKAVDAIRAKYGWRAVQRGSELRPRRSPGEDDHG
ncbi:MAG: DNA polymerase IV [Chloroflexota bacterium]